MKLSIQQLQKLTVKPYQFDEYLDLSHLAHNVSDIIEMKPVHVSGVITYLKEGTFRICYNINVLIIMECGLTLEPCPYEFNHDYDEVYSTNATEDEFIIEKNTIDMDEAVWSNIIIDKPMVVTREDAYEILKERGIVLNESEDDLID